MTMSKITLCAALLLTILTLSKAYNFNDPFYNQELAEEWHSLRADEPVNVVHSRSRRDEEAVGMPGDKCHTRKRKFCCAEESLQKAQEADRQMRRECYKKITGKERGPFNYFFHNDPFKCDTEKVEKAKKEMTCVAQCLHEKKGLVDEEGNLIEDKVKEETKNVFESEAWLTPKLDEIVDECLEEAKKANKKDEENCNGAGLMFGHCLWKKTQLSCPVEQIKDMRACNKVRERINNLPDFTYQMTKSTDDE